MRERPESRTGVQPNPGRPLAVVLVCFRSADDTSPAGNIGNPSLSVLEGEVPQGAPRALSPHRPQPPHACQRIAEALAGGEGAADLLGTEPFRMRGEEVEDLLPHGTTRSARFPRRRRRRGRC